VTEAGRICLQKGISSRTVRGFRPSQKFEKVFFNREQLRVLLSIVEVGERCTKERVVTLNSNEGRGNSCQRFPLLEIEQSYVQNHRQSRTAEKTVMTKFLFDPALIFFLRKSATRWSDFVGDFLP